MLMRLLSTYLLRRLLGGGRRSGRPRYGYRGYAPRYGYGARRRRSGGFRFFGPFPTYSTRTRRGSRVTVSGCCLPIPLALAVAMVGTIRALIRR